MAMLHAPSNLLSAFALGTAATIKAANALAKMAPRVE
jgi:hypothetical protein